MRFILPMLASIAVCASASAAPWTDPSQTISLDAPAGWNVAAAPAEGLTYVVAGSAQSECHVIALPRAGTAETPAQVIRIASLAPMSEQAWMQVAGAFPAFFPGETDVRSHSVSTDSFWPIQRADFSVAGAPPVFAAIQFRPGIELWTLCLGGAGDTATSFEPFFSSVGTPHDTALRAEAESQEASGEEHERQARAFAIGERERMTPVHGRDDDGYIVDPGRTVE